MVVGYDQNILRFSLLKFTLKANEDHVSLAEAHSCPDDPDCNMCRSSNRKMGFATNRFEYCNKDAASSVREFLEKEIQRDPVYVGAPIQILRINSAGRAQWIEKPAICIDQK